jgi:hypothetical protein
VAPPLPAQLTPDAQQIKSALDQLAKAQAELTASGIAVLNVAHALGRDAVAAFKDELVASLVQDDLLVDLDQLRAAAPSIPLPADLKLLPEASLNWLCHHFDICAHLSPGQEIEVPSSQLDRYDLQSPLPYDPKPLTKLRVIAPGWKRHNQSLIRPRAAMVTPAPAVSPDSDFNAPSQ